MEPDIGDSDGFTKSPSHLCALSPRPFLVMGKDKLGISSLELQLLEEMTEIVAYGHNA